MEKKKSLVKQFRNDDPSTYLTNVDQQKAMLLETIDDAKAKKIKKWVEPELNEDISKIAESRVRYETLRSKRKPPEIFEKNNSGLAGILQVSKRNQRLKGKLPRLLNTSRGITLFLNVYFKIQLGTSIKNPRSGATRQSSLMESLDAECVQGRKNLFLFSTRVGPPSNFPESI